MSAAAVGVGAFGLMVVLMLVGLPVAAVMLLLGLFGGLLAFGIPFLSAAASVVWSVMNENSLTAIPLFLLLGEFLVKSGMADRMYIVFAAWLGRLPGGLLHSNIACCALFAATSGSSVATAATIGTVALPSLRRAGYTMSDSLGSLAAGGTLGIMIPPSINFIIYGSMTNTPVGSLFIAGIIPGLMLAGLFMLYVFITHSVRGGKVKLAAVSWSERVWLLRYLVEPVAIFAVVMGSLYLGIATATEAAALGLIVAFALAGGQKKLNWALLQNCFTAAAKTTGMILFIIVGAFVLNLALSLTTVGDALTKWVIGFGFERVSLLALLVVFYLFLGMFMDMLSVLVATIPLVFPIVSAAGVDPIWFGVFIVLMCELGMITPPVGLNLFVMQGIRTDDGPLTDVIRGAMPYAAIMIIFAIILIFVPQLATWLPQLLRGSVD